MTEWVGGAPIYQQLADLLRSQMESGVLRPGDALPPARVLMVEHGVASSTVQKALRSLTAAGLIEPSANGRSMKVRDTTRLISRSADFVSPVADGQKPPHGKSTPVVVSEEVPSDDVAEMLRLDVDEPAVCRRRNMLEGGQVTEITASYIPKRVADGTPLATGGKLPGAMPAALKRLGYPPRSPAREWVDVRMPTAEESRILQIPPGVPVFRMLRLTKTDGDVPVEVLEMILPGHKYRLEYDLPIHE